MDIHTYSSPAALYRLAAPYLEKDEVRHNLALGILRQLVREEEKGKRGDAFLACGIIDDQPAVIFIQTPPRRMIICGKKQYMPEAAEWLYHNKPDTAGIAAGDEAADAFAEAWEELSPVSAKLVKRQVIYQLDHAAEWKQPPGKLTYACEDDAALVMDWTEQFAMGSLREEDLLELEERTMDEIRRNEVFFWRTPDYTPVSMAKRARELQHGVVVNYVYTPEEYERQGYATALVGALAERLMAEGFTFCSVNTNVENGASRSVYEKLGFEPAGISHEYSFLQ
ncbi:GNAT family N-acetyltransferase [Alkalicoccus urumqiensis]|uniref:N-acetyltransferase domain-containing protein n=1 Tax=Alkalicoccus urumqiensis TaxID=1548213 RepID=A0A2P6MEI0_ALKUR|nr:GNAT family N-acetyltransferase [Alkalicoccus urumqiensis]PRO64676.1 hypothetical protein C6I21_13295 [Alkalicoccus urumqiensis]